jgi:hypothetical protein
MKTLTQSDIPSSARYSDALVSLGSGLWVRIHTARDDNDETPWDRADGHGVVVERAGSDKRAVERILGGGRYYDFAASLKLALADGWDAAPYHSALPNETAKQQAVRAVERDFEFLRSWCADEWEYIGVIVTLEDADGRELGRESTWGIESCENPGHGYYWQTVAAEHANELASVYVEKQAERERLSLAEATERAHWEARDTVTI